VHLRFKDVILLHVILLPQALLEETLGTLPPIESIIARVPLHLIAKSFDVVSEGLAFAIRERETFSVTTSAAQQAFLSYYFWSVSKSLALMFLACMINCMQSFCPRVFFKCCTQVVSTMKKRPCRRKLSQQRPSRCSNKAYNNACMLTSTLSWALHQALKLQTYLIGTDVV
jgi:hypothetical protein